MENIFIKQQKGQSAVEYILLLVVIISIMTAIIRSDRFQSFIGKDAQIFKNIATQLQFSYRHGLEGGEEDNSSYTEVHDTYFSRDEGRSRFFTPATEYPGN